MEIFPSELACLLIKGFKEKQPLVLRGFANKKIIPNPTISVTASIKHNEDYVDFMDWYNNNIDYGGDPFILRGVFFGQEGIWTLKIIELIESTYPYTSSTYRTVNLTLEVLALEDDGDNGGTNPFERNITYDSSNIATQFVA